MWNHVRMGSISLGDNSFLLPVPDLRAAEVVFLAYASPCFKIQVMHDQGNSKVDTHRL